MKQFFTSKVFLIHLNFVPVLSSFAGSNLFICVFVSLTPASS